jgi:hypothetical protein
MLIEAIDGCGTLGGGMGKVPINEESFRRPTPKLSYLRGILAMNYMLLVHASELKKANWSMVITFH